MPDIIFFVDAVSDTGFGHAARCLILADIITENIPDIKIALRGNFSKSATERIISASPKLNIGPVTSSEKADLGIIDRMADPMDMNATDDSYNQVVANCCHKVIYIASGDIAPKVPDQVLVVGYQPSEQKTAANILWNLDYAPTNLIPLTGMPEADRLMIALGGSKDEFNLDKALAAVALTPNICHIDVLVSPVAENVVRPKSLNDKQTVSWHQNVPDITPLINKAGVILVSTGNLAYEAMALGTPVCLVGQKKFQVDIAYAMAAKGMAISAGLLKEISVEHLASALSNTIRLGKDLATRASLLVPLNGLQRLAELIMTHGKLK
jgi:spore coat polysaccharide biosynthesis predicted glycosyltransferase SpsG